MNSLFNYIVKDFFNLPTFIDGLDNGEYEKEEATYEKGDYKTTVTNYFTKEGYLAMSRAKSVAKSLLPSPSEEKLNQLMLEKDKALELEDYLRVAELHKEIKQLENSIKV